MRSLGRRPESLGRLLGWGCLVLVCCLSFGCSRKAPPPPVPTPPGTPPPIGTQKPYRINGVWYYPIPSAEGYREKGLASWYGRDWHGRLTSNGERYDMYALTAAHKILPMNTHVKVTHLRTGRSIVVRINDRGPFVPGRIIDLSYEAARQLGIQREGVAPVLVEAVRVASPVQVAGGTSWRVDPVRSYREGHFAVQVGSFRDRANAQRLRQVLADHAGGVYIRQVELDAGTFYRVQVGSYRNLDAANETALDLRRRGYGDAFVVAVED
ncbi:rare lipoprotein A [Desulfacinum infernum DSM 9756]|uniref:Probable endolytic peptidoglycan transglycosylase RlpA n=1 Tax=Desulfacinum infernum DSM 9756 TaxID=1121391 RepID=A0A1M4UT04_9BACT|nr:septal ring lytic transglycosylase RlpA family protein [Desulfacinum infernum]SHE59767.1 rare lipoprotein A [Desulfacinum infernum DSM 9756]